MCCPPAGLRLGSPPQKVFAASRVVMFLNSYRRRLRAAALMRKIVEAIFPQVFVAMEFKKLAENHHAVEIMIVSGVAED